MGILSPIMETMIKILDYIGHASTIIVVISTLAAVILWFKGILPVLLRLGNGLAKRKIAIFAKAENLTSLQNLLMHSGLFSQKNIVGITKKEDIGAAERATVYLVHWNDWSGDIDDVLRQRKDSEALIVYAPDGPGSIPQDKMKILDGKRNTAVTNFRGRLLNDIVTAMITTSYN